MRTLPGRFAFYLIVVLFSFAASKSGSGSVPPQGGNAAPIELQHDSRRFARSLANADAGEPRTVRLIYFLPNDQEFRPEVVQRMKDEIRRLQTFYREQMEAHGHGAKTFRVETDAREEPVVHRVDGQHRNSYYHKDDVAGTTLAEIEPLFDVYANIYLIVIDNHRARIGRLLGAQGRGFKLNKFAGGALLPGEFTFEVAAHELGHAFGLEHDFRDEAYIMSYGEGQDELSACSANFLSVHTYFDSDVPLDQDSRPTLELLSAHQYQRGAESVSVRFKVNDPDGLHQALLFSNTRRPHNATGFPEVVSCLQFAGETGRTAEFDYDGILPSSGFGSIAEWTTHQISVYVVDRYGNVAGEWIQLSEANTGQIATITTPSFNPKTLAFSRDGTLIATSGEAVSESYLYSPQARLLERTTGSNITTMDEAASVALSPDEMTVACGSWAGLITLRDIKTQEVTVRLHGHTRWSNALAFSSDGRTLASGSHDTTVKLWDVPSGKIIVTFFGHGDMVNSIAYSTDGRTVASGSADTTVKLWNSVTRSPVATLEEHSEPVRSVAFSPDGATLASATVDGDVILWDVGTGTSIARYAVDSAGVNSVAYSRDGILAVDGGLNKTVSLVDTTTDGNLSTLLLTEPVGSVAISPDGSVLATCISHDRSGTIELWNLSVLSERSNEIVPDAYLRTAVRISLGSPAGSPIGLEELAMVTELVASRASIFSLAGLEFASNLRYTVLNDNNISDISPLRGLSNLTSLGLSNNNISDTAPLSALNNLKHLFLAGNQISEISILANLTKLETLHLAVNSISDISPLVANSGLGEGDTLFLRRNPLNYEAVNSHIPLLQDRGVTVSFDDRTPTTLQPISGGEQQGSTSEPLTDPFVVEVRDEHGDVFEGVPVTFSVPDGSGRLSTTNATTDAAGRAQSILTLGERTGTILVTVSAAEIHEIAKWATFRVVSEATPTRASADVNGDGVVNILDLVQVAANFMKTGANDADVNEDGAVDILDLVQVAAAIGGTTAPSASPQAMSVITAADVTGWLAQAREFDLGDPSSSQGMRFLEQLLAALTPEEAVLLPNYPNPFNPETWIPYQLAQGEEVDIAIYDVQGALVRRLALGYQAAGYYADRRRAAYWDGRNEDGASVASGVYFYRLRAGGYSAVRRMVIVK